MRIFSVTPIHVGPDELARRQARYEALAPAGLEVVLADLPASAPRTFDTADAIAASDGLVAEALSRHPVDIDALLPDCVLDPAVEKLRGRVGVPVFGILRLALGWHVAQCGRSVSAVVRNAPIAAELRRQAGLAGFGDALGDVDVLDLDFDAVADGDAWSRALAPAVAGAAARGNRVVVNGCSAVELPPETSAGVRVVDPTALALRLLAAGEAA
ncbi:MAG: hypothetical protein ABS81_06435 [Pseudonocardia sp. SCN 72-86]|nr:MAG: hypothetical protein ABS81_06435 [Pseudonocardia sp. SCN 72-86]